MAYSVDLPIRHTFWSNVTVDDVIYYTLMTADSAGNADTVIYRGRVLALGSDDSLTIDIAPVLRDYVDVHYGAVMPDVTAAVTGGGGVLPVVDGSGSVMNFVVRSEHNGTGADIGLDVVYEVVYRYEDFLTFPLENRRRLNNPVSPYVSRDQILWISGYDLSGGQVVYNIQVNGQPISTAGEAVSISDGTGFHYFMYDLRTIADLQAGDTVRMTMQYADSSRNYTDYKVAAGCNHPVIYYVNKLGGLDSILCRGGFTHGWNARRMDADLYIDPFMEEARTRRIDQGVRRTLQVNTGLIPMHTVGGGVTASRTRIDHLIYSPKVWVMEMTDYYPRRNLQQYTVDESTYQVKKSGNGEFVNYTLNLTSSFEYMRR